MMVGATVMGLSRRLFSGAKQRPQAGHAHCLAGSGAIPARLSLAVPARVEAAFATLEHIRHATARGKAAYPSPPERRIAHAT